MTLEGLVCPYSRCGQHFDQPVMVTDYSKLPRETYYACPHCMLRLELLLDSDVNMDVGPVHVRAVDDDTLLSKLGLSDSDRRLGEAVSNPQATRPSKGCRHFLGFLRNHPQGVDLPDECAICSEIVQCYIKRE